MLWADCVAFVELAGESRAVLLGVNTDLGAAENGLTSSIAVLCACEVIVTAGNISVRYIHPHTKTFFLLCHHLKKSLQLS